MEPKMEKIVEFKFGDKYDESFAKKIVDIVRKHHGDIKVIVEDLDFSLIDIYIFNSVIRLDSDVYFGASIKGRESVVNKFAREVLALKNCTHDNEFT